ncbi:hypothetical protein GCM10011363_28920 [Marivita lacus]|uniref:Uncharacterized protein n=1 Tax=Marivita lacus TaxID=1323742 RepID=A0ABQ1KWG8_9RHOB|nr:hypothetical protein GCM10011363_28920 [Marivita lacus]
MSGIGPKEPHYVALRIPGDDRIEDIPPAIGVVDVAMAQDAAFQHTEPVEQKIRVIAGAVEVPVPGGTFLIAVCRADGTVRVEHDIRQLVAVMEPIDLLICYAHSIPDIAELCPSDLRKSVCCTSVKTNP